MRINKLLGRFFLNKIYNNLRVKITIAAGILISAAVIFLGISLTNNSRIAVKRSVLANHKEIVVRAAEEVSLLLKRSEDVLSATAAVIGAAHLNPWQQETVLVGLAIDQPAFIRASSFDLSGKMLATSDLGRFLVLNYTDNIMQKPAHGQMYISEVKFQDNNYLPYLSMSLPVRQDSMIKGVLAADINLRSLWNIVDGIRIGNTGRAFLVSGDGTLIASVDKKRVLKNENIRWQKDVDAALYGRNEAIILKDAYGVKWVSSYAPVPGTDWGIVLRQQEKEAYLFSRIMQWQSWLIIIFCEIVALLAATWLARIFSRPVSALLSKIKNIASGNAAAGQPQIKRGDELGQLAKVFDDLADKLKTAKASERFTSAGEAAVWVAHELKNSLSPIKSFVQMLPSRHTDGKFIDRFKDIVPEEIRRCERMLKELSDFSSPAALRLVRLNLKEIIDDVLKVMEDELSENNVEVRLKADTTNLHIQGDYEKLKQVFINLVINAISAMPQGGSIELFMRVIRPASLKDDSFVEITIGDTGMGIPQDRLRNIFEPFRTTKKEGVGLGLAISHKIIQQHGGQIWVESQIEKGTVFTIRFPQLANNFKENGVISNNAIG